jgi:glycine cleavage system H protein
MVEKDLVYTKDHEWARIEDDVATIGITDHAQEMLGEITFVELPAVGTEVTTAEEIAVVESSKSASDIYSPVTGKVIEINDNLEDSPESINDDCYGNGWLCKIEITDKGSIDELMSAEQYEEHLKEID